MPKSSDVEWPKLSRKFVVSVILELFPLFLSLKPRFPLNKTFLSLLSSLIGHHGFNRFLAPDWPLFRARLSKCFFRSFIPEEYR